MEIPPEDVTKKTSAPGVFAWYGILELQGSELPFKEQLKRWKCKWIGRRDARPKVLTGFLHYNACN